MNMILETTNPNWFTYKTEELLVKLVGGVRINTLDRMRVTIKVKVANRLTMAFGLVTKTPVC